MRRAWRLESVVKSKSKEVTKSLVNSANYSESMNYGHGIVDKLGKTKGWVKGQFILEKTIDFIEIQLVKEFRERVDRVNKKHDK